MKKKNEKAFKSASFNKCMPTYEYMLLNTLEYKMFAKKKKKL